MATKAPARPSEFFSFYGGKVKLEKKPWGDHFRFIKNGEKGGMFSASAITKYLDKSGALLPWAIGLVGGHVRLCAERAETFSRDEILLIVEEAVLKPEEGKTKGGKTGDIIHDFAHAFGKSKKFGTPTPKLPKLSDFEEGHITEEDLDRSLNGINAFLDWYNSHNVEFLEMEQTVYYNSLLAGDSNKDEPVVEYAGILDCIARIDGKIKVLDYKTGKRVYTDQRYQLAGYAKAWNSNPDNKGKFAVGFEVLNFSKDTGELNPVDISLEGMEKDFSAFRGLYFVACREKELEAERVALNKIRVIN